MLKRARTLPDLISNDSFMVFNETKLKVCLVHLNIHNIHTLTV